MFTKEEITKNLKYLEELDRISDQLKQIKEDYAIVGRNEKVQLTKSRKKLEDDQEYLKKLVNWEIPRPMNPEEMKKRIDIWLKGLVNRFQQEYNQFMTDIVKPPDQAIYAITRRLDDFVSHGVWWTWHSRFTETLQGLEGEEFVDRFLQFCDEVKTELSNEILLNVSSGVGRSTSPSHNIVEVFQTQAEAKLLGRFDSELLGRYREAYSTWKFLNS